MKEGEMLAGDCQIQLLSNGPYKLIMNLHGRVRALLYFRRHYTLHVANPMNSQGGHGLMETRTKVTCNAEGLDTILYLRSLWEL